MLSKNISQASSIRQKLAKLNEPSNTVAFWDVWKVFKREKAVFLRAVAVWKHRVVPFIAGPTSALAPPVTFCTNVVLTRVQRDYYLSLVW